MKLNPDKRHVLISGHKHEVIIGKIGNVLLNLKAAYSDLCLIMLTWFVLELVRNGMIYAINAKYYHSGEENLLNIHFSFQSFHIAP